MNNKHLFIEFFDNRCMSRLLDHLLTMQNNSIPTNELQTATGLTDKELQPCIAKLLGFGMITINSYFISVNKDSQIIKGLQSTIMAMIQKQSDTEFGVNDDAN